MHRHREYYGMYCSGSSSTFTIVLFTLLYPSNYLKWKRGRWQSEILWTRFNNRQIYVNESSLSNGLIISQNSLFNCLV